MPFRLRHHAAFLPLCAALAVMGCGSDTPSATQPEVTAPAPDIVRFEGPPSPQAPGDLIQFYVQFLDTVDVRRIILRVESSFAQNDTVDLVPPKRMIAAIVTIVVPVHAKLGFPAATTLTVEDQKGRTATAVASALIKDFRPPAARLTLRGFRSDHTIGTGDLLTVHVYASDNHQLRYIGFEGGGMRDSVAASELGDSHDFEVAVPPSWRVERPVLRAWARDEAGNVSPTSPDNVREVPVYDWVVRPVETTSISGYPYPAEVLWDAKRDAAYVLRYDDGSGEQSDIVRVKSGVAETLVSLPHQAFTFTLSATGDSLIVPIHALNTIGIVDLRLSVPSLTLLPVQHELGLYWLLSGAQASGTHLFVSLVGYAGQSKLLDINLATGAQVIRSDLDGGEDAPPRPSLLRLADGRLLICAESPSYFPLRFVYSPSSDGFTPTARLRDVSPGRFSASPSGRFMLGDAVYDAALDSVAAITSRDWRPGLPRSAALSADGAVTYLGTEYGYEKRRVSDGALLEQVNLGAGSYFLVATPDGTRLIVLGALPGTTSGEFALRIVDLR